MFMKEQRLKRILAARLLLAVFLPMLLLTSLHRHDFAQLSHEDCEACVNHVSHSGHLSTAAFSLHDCVICQFTGISYVAAAAVMLAVLGCAVFRFHAVTSVACVVRVVNRWHGRAPPCCF
jgi:hypothetical protein